MQKIRKVLWSPAAHRTKEHELDLKASNKLHPDCRRFWDNYLHLRDRSYTPFRSLSPLFIQNRRVVEWFPENEIRLSDWLESVHRALAVDSPDSLIIW